MIGFIIGAALLALLATLFVVFPLLRSKTGARAAAPAEAAAPSAAPAPSAMAALVSALVLVAVSAVAYSLIGSPAGIRPSAGGAGGTDRAGTAATSTTIASLARRLEQHPDDLASWTEIGAAYATAGQYGLALRAYQRADQLSSGQDASVLADIGEVLLLRDNGAGSREASQYLERALALDPSLPKALFYSALIAYQGGQLQLARDRFQALLKVTPPPPENLRVALQRQIEQIDGQLHPKIDPATAIHLRVQLAPPLLAKVPPNASLFVFVRSSDGGPPLAVKRSAVALPQDVDLSAADAMVASRSVQPGQKVTVVARISASGSPLPQSGDLYGQIDYVVGKTGPRALEIDQQTP